MRLEAAHAQKSRRMLLWVSLLLTFALVYWQWSVEQGADDEATVADNTPANTASNMNNTPPVAAPAKVTTRVNTEADGEHGQVSQAVAAEAAKPVLLSRKSPATHPTHALFAAHEWVPPPPKPEPPPPPQAPPVPFTYVGSMQDVPDGYTIILMQQKKVLMPKVGGQVNAQWRLDSEDAQAVYFTYLPLNQAVTLSKAKAAANQRQSMAETQPEDNIPLEQ